MVRSFTDVVTQVTRILLCSVLSENINGFNFIYRYIK